MWRLNDGDRVLTEPEWACFVAGLGLLRDSIEDDLSNESDDTETGIVVFDRLTAEQKLAILADTAEALRDPVIPTPPHTAANEGTIAAVFQRIWEEVEFELESVESSVGKEFTGFRRLLRGVFEDEIDQNISLPDETDSDIDEWIWLFEEFQERIFWDDDFSMADDLLDLPPEVSEEVMAKLTIDREYFVTIPPEPTEAGLVSARQKLARMLGLPVPDENGFYPYVEDLYHDLRIGPCSAEQQALWADHPWLEIAFNTQPHFDCDYTTWIAEFSSAIPAQPFALGAGQRSIPDVLPNGICAEQREDSWYIRDERMGYWQEILLSCWTDSPDDDDDPALSFSTEEAANSAFLQADRMYSDRVARRKAAFDKLGRPEPDFE